MSNTAILAALLVVLFVALVAIEIAGRSGWNPILRAADAFTRPAPPPGA